VRAWCGFPPRKSGVHRLVLRRPRGDDLCMTRDILIAGSMALTSVIALLAIVLSVARALREEPEAA
jgi:hypothetical protein